MYAPHTVTVYNSVKETDLTTFEEVARLYVTILRGVMLQASKGVNVRESGLEGADAVNLYIPFGVEAVDGTTGASKTYTGPQSFFKAADKSSLWTLSVNGDGGTTFFVKGEFVTDNRVKGKYMYRKTAAELPQIAERGAQEIEKKAMAYLEGKG